MKHYQTNEKKSSKHINIADKSNYIEIPNPAYYLICSLCGWDMKHINDNTLLCECGNNVNIYNNDIVQT